MDEKVLVVRKSIIDKLGQGHCIIKIEEECFLSIINENAQFELRSQAESNYEYKQIIPYVVFFYKNQVFCTYRKTKQLESRLHNMLSIGIGGHINEGDLCLQDDCFFQRGMNREINEEVLLPESIHPQFVGIINHNEVDVDSVHVGVCYFVDLLLCNLKVNEDEKMYGEFVDIPFLYNNRSKFEEWSKIVIDYIWEIKL